MRTAEEAVLAHCPGPAADALATALERRGVVVLRAPALPEALALAHDAKVGLVIAELELAGGGGLALMQLLRRREGLVVPFVLLADRGETEQRVHALHLGAEEVLAGELPLEEQVARIERVLRGKARLDRLTAENTALRQLAVTDGLTQLSNHQHFQDRLLEEFRRAARYNDPLSLILVDLDHFKEVNDRFGHPAGDAVLRQVGELLQRSVRETDLLARYGGEEFAVLLPKTGTTGAVRVAERIWRNLNEVAFDEAGGEPVTASLGLATHPTPPYSSAVDLLRAADGALYSAKRLGRNRICIVPSSSPVEEATTSPA